MVFASYPFLHVFLPIALIAGFAAWKWFGVRAANLVLVLLSAVFYIWGPGVEFIWLIAASIVGNYALAFAVDRARGTRAIRWWIALVVVANIGVLGYFKYANFFVDQINAFGGALGAPVIDLARIALPIGVSFFTFHAMSYVFDVASGRAKHLKSLSEYALYILFFPQLIAGPIVRFQTIEGQIRARAFDRDLFLYGVQRFAHGLCKKVLIADPAGAIADAVFGAPAADLSAPQAWAGALAYTVQIYFDFSGYTDMAIGLAAMFGFRFPENFARPYSATSISDFWRRWHISLSSWFRDYLYIPLGGSKGGVNKTYRNLLIVFLLTGLWHGAAWTFVIWGLYHGLLVLAERALGIRDTGDAAGRARNLPEIMLRRGVTFGLVLVGWVLFRAHGLDNALHFIHAMFTPDFRIHAAALAGEISTYGLFVVVLGACVVLLPPDFRGWTLYTASDGWLKAASTLALAIAFIGALSTIWSGAFSPFLYFQF